MKTKEEQIKRLKEYAYWLLGRRDYSEFEIITKFKAYMLKKEYTITEDDALMVIDALREKDYLNDERMARAVIRSLSLNFRGPMKIKTKFYEKRLDLSFLENFEDEEIDWFELCKEYYNRKYSVEPIDYNDKSKRYKHLAGRGYSSDQIKYALDQS